MNLSFDQLITFSRTSAATYVNSAGNVVSAPAGTPRFDYDPATLAPKGLLIESQRTNLLLRSEEFDDAAWIKTAGTSITANATTAPDGTSTADQWVKGSGTTGAADLYCDMAVAALNTAHSFSFYAKANGIPAVRVIGGGSYSPNGNSRFNLELGTVAAGTGAIQAAGNGWYRCTIFITRTSTADNIVYITPCNADGTFPTGDGTSGIFIWGAQLEAGNYATSYIPTAGSQVTRTADVASIVAPNFAPWYNQSEGTFVVEVDTAKPPSVNATILAIDASDGGISNRHYLGFSTGLAEGRTAVGGVTQVSLTQAYAANATEKLAYAYKANDFALARNGSLAGTDASGSLPTIDRMFIGNAAGSAAFLDGHIRSIRYFPTRLSNAQLQALSA